MIRYIKASSSDELVFDIELHYECFQGIEAAFNPDLSDKELDAVIEEDAEEEYYSFMNSVALNLEMNGFEILEGPDFSNRKGSKSCYFVMCKSDEYDQLNVKFILNLRISDHRLTKHNSKGRTWNRFEARDKYYQNELENYRELNTDNPDEMKYGLTEIIVSGQKFKTFRAALNHIITKVKSKFQLES